MSEPFGLRQLGQVAVPVRDMERAVAFYRDVLGMKFLFQAPNVPFFDAGGVRLMLGQNEKADAAASETILYYRVDRIREAFEILTGRGARAERAPALVAKMPDHELWLAFLRDLDGNVVGLTSEVRA